MHQPGAIPDPRNPVDRRQRDGLGLLPRARTPEERRARHRANVMIGEWLIALGLVPATLGLRSLVQAADLRAWALLTLGSVVLIQGVMLVRRKERRKADRRAPRAEP